MASKPDLAIRIAADLSLPIDAVTETFLILGKRGSGKTSTATVLTEGMITAGQTVCVIDPTGAWWGLRASADGAGPGLPVTILGGEHADLPLTPESGSVIADLLIEERLPLVLDLSEMSKTQQRRFVCDFLERVYHRNRDPLHVVVDEADLFCMSADTEVLTPEGWARWDQMRVGKEVVAFSPETGEFRNEPVQRLIFREHDGEMVRLKTKGIDQLVTPDHRVVLRRLQRGVGRSGKVYDWTFCQAAEVPTCIQVPLGGAPAGPGIDIDDDMLRILGWVITDGYINSQPGRRRLYGIEQSHRSVKCGRSIVATMGSVLDSMPGVGRYERGARTTGTGDAKVAHGASAVWWFREEASTKIAKWLGDDTHRIPRQIMEEASPAQLRILLQALLEGDGTSVDGFWASFYPGHNEGLADDFQEVATRLGVSTVKLWVPSIRQWQVTVSRRRHHHVRRPTREAYKGLVWDITVPSGAFVARRNGRVFVTGNCPMRATGEIARLIGAYEDVVRRGRLRGIGSTSITQRPAGMHTDIRSQTEVLIALRMMGTHDIAAIDDWVRLHATDEEARELKASLPSLPVGTAWVWSPGWLGILQRVQVQQRRTFDSSATPKVGQQRVVPREFARPDPADIDRLITRLRAVVEQASQDDPKALQRKIAGLQRQLATRDRDNAAARAAGLEGHVASLEAELAAARAREPERVEVPVLQPGEIAAVEQALTGIRDLAGDLATAASRLEAALARARTAEQLPVVASSPARQPAAARSAPRPPAAGRELPTPAPPAAPAGPAPALPPPSSEGVALKAGERRMLETLARQHPLRLTRAQLGAIAKFKASGGTFRSYLSTLVRAGLVTSSGDYVILTDAGFTATGTIATEPVTASEIRDTWNAVLKAGERAMLDHLVGAYPGAVSREELAEVTGFEVSGGTFRSYLSTLRRNDLAVDTDEGVRAADVFFLTEGSTR